jgi:hypothetical protein
MSTMIPGGIKGMNDSPLPSSRLVREKLSDKETKSCLDLTKKDICVRDLRNSNTSLRGHGIRSALIPLRALLSLAQLRVCECDAELLSERQHTLLSLPRCPQIAYLEWLNDW